MSTDVQSDHPPSSPSPVSLPKTPCRDPDTSLTPITPTTARSEVLASPPMPTSPPNTTPLRKLTCFPLLPREVRESIWKFAVNKPKIVKRGIGNRVPAIFHVCQESRVLAKNYHILGSGKLPKGSHYFFYINPEQDILYLKSKLNQPPKVTSPNQTMTGICHPTWTTTMKRVALPLDDAARHLRPVRNRTGNLDLWSMISFMFPELEELIILKYPHPKSADTIEDLKIIHQNNGGNIPSGLLFGQEPLLSKVFASWKLQTASRNWKFVRLTCMKVKETADLQIQNGQQ